MSMNPRLLRPLASVLNPASIPGLAWWLDASDASTVTLNGSTVSAWADKSGNARNTSQATSNNQPSYANFQNNKKVITFDGSNDSLTCSQFIMPAGGYTIFAVASHAGGFDILLEGGGFSPYISALPNGTTGFSHSDGLVEVNTPSGVYTLNQFFVLEIVVSPAARKIIVDGTERISGAGTSRTASFQAIGASSAGSFFWDGKVGEVLIYTSAMDDAIRSRVRKYLGPKWAVSVT